MKVTWKKLLISAMALSQVQVLAQPILVARASDTQSMTDASRKRMADFTEAVSKAKGSKSKGDIEHAIKIFSTLFTNDDPDGSDFLFMSEEAISTYDQLINLIVEGSSGTMRSDLMMSLIHAMALKVSNENQLFYFTYLDDLLTNNKVKELEGRIETTTRILNQAQTFPENIRKPGAIIKINEKGELELTQEYPMDIPDIKVEEEFVDVGNPDIQKGSIDFDISFDDSTWEDVYYEVVDGKNVEVTIVYTRKDGKTTSKVNKKVVEAGALVGGSKEEWDLLNDNSTLQVLESDNAISEDEAQNVRSNLSLHYTVTKGTDEIYYYDTGMRVQEDGTATYQQVKDVLYQLALRAEGYLADDKDKFLIVVEGRPVLIQNKKESYSKEEVEKMFKGFERVDMRIMQTRIGTTASLEEQLVSGKPQGLKLNGEDQDLKHQPIVEDSRVLLSVKELGELFGLTIEEDGEKVIVTDADKMHTVIYETNVKAVVVNGKSVETSVASTKTKEGTLMGDVNELLKTFNIGMVWDEENSLILLTTN